MRMRINIKGTSMQELQYLLMRSHTKLSRSPETIDEK